ncbi:unnamed protein product [Caenorhabditis angaria]|uniref:Uncharacterized protein n=1 Tax=Caenorhabditis angaria TaxID=860376 RepID=A0A9P1N9X0_9PELO|nr:unnamed protein product [Caenorhabditis angaria]
MTIKVGNFSGKVVAETKPAELKQPQFVITYKKIIEDLMEAYTLFLFANLLFKGYSAEKLFFAAIQLACTFAVYRDWWQLMAVYTINIFYHQGKYLIDFLGKNNIDDIWNLNVEPKKITGIIIVQALCVGFITLWVKQTVFAYKTWKNERNCEETDDETTSQSIDSV